MTDKDDVAVRYVWFCGINASNGVDVYTTLPGDVTIPEEPETPNQEPDNTIDENPNTYDGIMSYVMLSILGCAALGYTTKKVLSR